MKKVKSMTLTLRLVGRDAELVEYLSRQSGWNISNTIRHTVRIGHAYIARDTTRADKIVEAFDVAVATSKIRADAEKRIADLKNLKR